MKCDRLLTWQCYGQHYVDAVFAQLKTNALGDAIRNGEFEAVIYTRNTIPAMPHVTAHPGPESARKANGNVSAKLAKIHTPLLFPDAVCSVSMDADLRWHDAIVERLGWLFDAVERFGFVVTAHPAVTWTREPMAQKQYDVFIQDAGMVYLQSLYMTGVVGRKHKSQLSRKLTAAWIREFPNDEPEREQPALARAVWTTGLTPLAAPMTLLSWPASVDRPHNRIPLFRHDPK